MALLDPLYKLADICADFGVENVIVCPGSRSAALTLAFNRNQRIKTQVVVDERSAAFIALGLAQITQKTVAMICTSGTAALNFSPAIAEAYFQKIPLLILTADRPPEWINQHDGQTIYQRDIYGKHVVKSFEFPTDYSHQDAVWQTQRQANEALVLTQEGPVHINIPIREPFYPAEGEKYSENYSSVSYIKGESVLGESVWNNFLKTWQEASEIIIPVGQNHANLNTYLEKLNQDSRVSVWADVISNVYIKNKICTQDTFLPKLEDKAPALLITLGESFISKPFKQYFRRNKAEQHWHIGLQTELIDPLQSISCKINVSSEYFLQQLSERVTLQENEVLNPLKEINQKAKDYILSFVESAPFGELKAIYSVLKSLTETEVLHLGNSMPVRYANTLGAFVPDGVTVFANRGTSGIEGIVSTAIGHALGTSKTVNCLVGDVSFFYDSNAIFAANPDNIKIFLLNNAGGNIFRMIDGPKGQAELETHFITNPKRTAKNISQEAGYKYHEIRSEEDLAKALNDKEGVAALFEIFLDGVKDATLFKELKLGYHL